MQISNFSIVVFNEHLGDNVGDINAPKFTFVGNETSLRKFTVPGVPSEDGYLIISAYDVQNSEHRIQINGRDLPNQDIPPSIGNTWKDTTDYIPSGFLQQGQNTIQIQRARGSDNILIAFIIIHWKEDVVIGPV
ncbi:DUF7383 domain-containing protein [Nitrosomonas communis]|uniref:Uncharacterized protein n=1 Tax=Nitrosomonas communis TaxID=44574 RepID=A0A1I4WWH2_9PROT|nr:hypothetical protein [Nitrosomonas communis]SFN17825.1 hypothetical protein SAMN05421863_11234 [Nitrosomonas communis]